MHDYPLGWLLEQLEHLVLLLALPFLNLLAPHGRSPRRLGLQNSPVDGHSNDKAMIGKLGQSHPKHSKTTLTSHLPQSSPISWWILFSPRGGFLSVGHPKLMLKRQKSIRSRLHLARASSKYHMVNPSMKL